MRKLDAAKSTPLEPVLSLREARRRSRCRANRFVKVTIPLYYQGHAYRAGSRIRVTITAPERRPADLGVRRDASPKGTADGRDRLLGAACRRACMLPVVPGVDVPTELPPCPGLRGEPCRDYQPFANR